MLLCLMLTTLLGGATGNASELVQVKEYPFSVAIVNKETGEICTGSIITKQWVLTAAHSVIKDHQTENYQVIAGVVSYLDRGKNFQTRSVENIWRHPEYRVNKIPYNDIALVQLKKPLKFNKFVESIGLSVDMPPYGADSCTALGFGRNKWEVHYNSPEKLKRQKREEDYNQALVRRQRLWKYRPSQGNSASTSAIPKEGELPELDEGLEDVHQLFKKKVTNFINCNAIYKVPTQTYHLCSQGGPDNDPDRYIGVSGGPLFCGDVQTGLSITVQNNTKLHILVASYKCWIKNIVQDAQFFRHCDGQGWELMNPIC